MPGGGLRCAKRVSEGGVRSSNWGAAQADVWLLLDCSGYKGAFHWEVIGSVALVMYMALVHLVAAWVQRHRGFLHENNELSLVLQVGLRSDAAPDQVVVLGRRSRYLKG